MYKIFLAPLIDSLMTYIIEQPIQYYFYMNYFKNLSLRSSAILITFLSIIINLFIIFVSYSFLFKTSISDNRFIIHTFIVFISILFIGPLYFYFSLKNFSNHLPEQIIFYSIILYYIISYIGKVFITFYIWGDKPVKS